MTVEGFAYEGADAVCRTKIGTVKSRVDRARARLTELTGVDSAEDAGPDRVVRAALEMGAMENLHTAVG